MILIRQGDVAIIPHDVPADAVALPPKDGLHVLAYGEATGHLHAVRAERTRLLRRGLEMYLVVFAAVKLRHGDPARDWQGDHDTRIIPPGEYRVIIEREYTPQGWRQVED